MFCQSRLLLVFLDLQLIFQAASRSEGLANRKSLSGAHTHIAASKARVEGVEGDNAYTDASGPKTLKAYCEGDSDDIFTGYKIRANWLGFGVWYKGNVIRTNEDGTLDVLFYDGWVERAVPQARIRKIPDDEGFFPGKKKADVDTKANDAACELKDLINKVKGMSEDAFMDVAAWLASRRQAAEEEDKARRSQGPAPAPAPALSPAAAPAGAIIRKQLIQDLSPEEQEEVKYLEEKLKQLHGEIGTLKEETAENHEKLKNFPGSQPSENPIIKEYRWQVVEENERVRNLELEKARQEKEIALENAKKGMELPLLMNHSRKLQEELDLLRQKREEFRRTNRLDPELRTSIDTLLEQQQRLTQRIKELSKVRSRFDKTKEALSSGESVAEAADKHKVADQELQLAAEAVGRDLRSVSKEAHQLDTGVHPHGQKWWRYRYEHNYVESCIMIVLLVFMMSYEALIFWFRLNVLVHSHESLHKLFTTGTLYTKWVEQLLIDLAACLLVTLTVWAADELGGFDFLSKFMAVSDVGPEPVLHLPTSAREYKAMAVNASVVLFVSMVMYSFLSLAVVRQSMNKITKWADREEMPESRDRTRALLRDNTGHGLSFKASDFWMLFTYFEEQGFDMEADDFWKYLRCNVGEAVEGMLRFGVRQWCNLLLSFVVLTLLHRALHIDYYPVMVGMFCLLVAFIIFMIVIVQSLRLRLEGGEPSENPQTAFGKAVDTTHKRLLSRLRPGLGWCLQYNLFFLCFGMARLLSYRWLWELHFWPVLYLTGLELLCGLVYIFFVTPVVPTFAATLALPPYIDNEHVQKIKSAMKYSTTAAAFQQSSAVAAKTSWFQPYTTLRDLDSINTIAKIETLTV